MSVRGVVSKGVVGLVCGFWGGGVYGGVVWGGGADILLCM